MAAAASQDNISYRGRRWPGIGSADPRALTFTTAAVCVAATMVVAASPAVRFAYDAPSLHIFVETTAGLIALLGAYLVFGRFRQSGRADDLVLSCALVILSASSLLLQTLPLASGLGTGSFPTWAPLAGRMLVALLLAAAAFSSPTRLRDPHRVAVRVFSAAGLVLAAIGIIVALLADDLPAGMDPGLSPHEALAHPQLSGHPVVIAAQFVSATLYAAAAVGFTRRVERIDDELLRWLSAGSILASVASIHYLMFPSLYSQWLYTGDLVRLLAYLALLAGAARAIGRYWKSLAAAAVLEERRRIARDLHDGLAQDLAFILRRAKQARETEHAVGDEIASAAERAIDDTRAAIAALARPPDEPLDLALEAAVETVADGLGPNVVLDLQPQVRVDPATRDELIRIAREAVSNAARHGRARTIRLQLSNGRQIRLRIADDGVGFEPSRIDRRKQFGIFSMSERARALDAEFHLTSAPGRGTEIEVILP